MAPGGDWSCPVCMRSAAPMSLSSNPPNRRAKSGQRQKRIKRAHEAARGERWIQKAAAKAAAPAGHPAQSGKCHQVRG